MPSPNHIAFLLLLLAPAAGSFIGVLADRLPRGESVIRPGSRCRACGAGLGPRDLIPLLSFLLLRGRCRHCAAPLPGWLFHAELAATALVVPAIFLAPDAPGMVVLALGLWLLLGLALTDLLWFRLPDVLTGALLLLALALSLWPGALATPAPGAALAGAGAGAGSFWLLRLGYWCWRGREGLGLGDAKLMAGLGALVGPWELPLLVLLAALAGLGLAGAQAMRHGRTALSGTRPLPFGAALCAAGAGVWLWRLTLLPGWY